MSGETDLGYPFPNSSDPIAGMADIIQALAQAVNDLLGAQDVGTNTVNIVNTDTYYDKAVVFVPGRFTVAPKVVVSRRGSSPHTSFLAVKDGTITTTGFTATAKRTPGTADIEFDWIAVQNA
jgi:hypothetical protein